jgi:hypothetical protein
MIKAQKELGVEGMLHILIKALYDKHIANINILNILNTLNREQLKHPC